MYAGGNTCLAFLRRDGFASMDADQRGGTLTTRPVIFQGRHLFVNLAASQGELRVEVLNEAGQVIAPFSAENCAPLGVDATCQPVHWKGANDLSAMVGRKVKFRFYLRQGTTLRVLGYARRPWRQLWVCCRRGPGVPCPRGYSTTLVSRRAHIQKRIPVASAHPGTGRTASSCHFRSGRNTVSRTNRISRRD